MSSINTNVAAMTALQTLTQTNKQLTETQNRISTGYRVADASDNAAYWSIATTMRSDNAALSTVQDALGLGAATVDAAYTRSTAPSMSSTRSRASWSPRASRVVDRTKIQSEITELQKQLKRYRRTPPRSPGRTGCRSTPAPRPATTRSSHRLVVYTHGTRAVNYRHRYLEHDLFERQAVDDQRCSRASSTPTARRPTAASTTPSRPARSMRPQHLGADRQRRRPGQARQLHRRALTAPFKEMTDAAPALVRPSRASACSRTS